MASVGGQRSSSNYREQGGRRQNGRRECVASLNNTMNMPAAGLTDHQGIPFPDWFIMYDFKVRPCSRAFVHDWTQCPYYHPREKAVRRDLKSVSYSCIQCVEFREQGTCSKGDYCEFAHGLFETWLHPGLYRTRMCKDGEFCNRKLCFFAHNTEQKRPIYKSTGSGVPDHTDSVSPTGSSSTTYDDAFASTTSYEASSNQGRSVRETEPQAAVDDRLIDRSDIGLLYKLQQLRLTEELYNRGCHTKPGLDMSANGPATSSFGAGKSEEINTSRMLQGYDQDYFTNYTSQKQQQQLESLYYDVLLNQSSRPNPFAPISHPGLRQDYYSEPQTMARNYAPSRNSVSGTNPQEAPFDGCQYGFLYPPKKNQQS